MQAKGHHDAKHQEVILAISHEKPNSKESIKPEVVGTAAGGGDTSLEYLQNVVTEPTQLGTRYELAKCGCDCWYCEDCCERKGYNLRNELIGALDSFQNLLMITLTIDPELFDSHEEAYFYLRENRCISVLMQGLDRLGHLNSRKYFYVLEFQESGNPHYHLIVDAKRIPHGDLLAEWSKNRPVDKPTPEANRPPFGLVWISKRHFAGGALHAARYATKYLVKVPEYGWPDWVLKLGSDKRVPRYGASRKFWNRPKSKPKSKRRTRVRSNSVSYALRLEQCGSTTNLFGVTRFVMPNDEIKEQRQWIARLGVSTDIFEILDEFYEIGSRRAAIWVNQGHKAIEEINKAAGRPVQVLAVAKYGAKPNVPS